MKIEKNKVVGIHYTLKDPEGKTIDSSQGKEPLFYLHGQGQLVPGLETALEGLAQGDKKQVVVPPEQGYGQRNDEMVQTIGRDQFEPGTEIKEGMQFRAQNQNGTFVVTVTEVKGDQVTIDANHQLAGIPLDFDVEVTEVRDATEDEIAHGHVHGPGGVEH